MKLRMATLGALALVMAGCETQQPPRPTPQGSVLDVSPRRYPTPTYAQDYSTQGYPTPMTAQPVSQTTYVPPGPGPAYLPPGASPAVSASVTVEAPAVSTTPKAPAAPASKSKAKTAKGTYTVQRGDTLFHIAQVQYGDGKKWKQIVAANSGLTPTTLKTGQKIVLP